MFSAARFPLWRWYTLSAFRHLSIAPVLPIYTLFLRSLGLDLLQTNLVNVAFFSTLLLMDVPTGYIADRYGRRLSCFLASVIIATGILWYVYADSFISVVIGEVLVGIGSCFFSGAFHALVLKECKGEEWKHFIHGDFILTNLVFVLGGIGSGWLAQESLRVPYVVAGICSLMWVGASVLLLWPISSRTSLKENHSTEIPPPENRRALVQSHLSGRFVFLCLIPALSMLCMQPVNMQWTILFRDRGVPLPLIGGISGAIGLVIAGGGWVSKRFLGERHMGAVVLTICVGVVGTVLLPGLWGLAPFLVHEVGRGAFGPLLHSLLVRETPERYRATLLSVRSTVMSIGAIIGLILSGYAAQQFGITATWVGAGGLFLCGSIVLLLLLQRKGRGVY